MKKIVIYGLGEKYKLHESQIRQDYDVVFIADNDPKKWGGYNGIPVGSIKELVNYNFDFILVSVLKPEEIVNQLRNSMILPKEKKIYELTDYEPPCVSWEALDLILTEYEFDTVLDIGCGEGIHSKMFMEKGKRVTCVDKGGSIYFEKNTEKANVIIGDFNDIDFSNASFDCCWCSHVLEHQLNVNLFLKKIHSVLKEDGVLAITVPTYENVICSGHYTYWNPGMLLYNLIMAGFDCSNARVGSYDWWNLSVVLKKKTIKLPDLNFDAGDIEKLMEFFPPCIEYEKQMHNGYLIFDGKLKNINWPTPRYAIKAVDD